MRSINIVSAQLYSQREYAILQSLGIDIYQALRPIEPEKMPWLHRVFELLEIDESACRFSGNIIEFDAKTRQLVLPECTYLSEMHLKQAIWKKIQPFVSQGH